MSTVKPRKPLIGNVPSGKSWGLPGTGPDPNAIVFPERTTLDQAYGSVQNTGLIPKYKPIDFTPITGFDKKYYKNLSDQASKRLNQQYFSNPDSVTNQFTNTINKRGLLGSGIESGGLQNIYKDFGSQMADMQSNLEAEKAKNDLELAKTNTSLGLQTDTSNRDFQSQLAELGLNAATNEARTASDYGTKIFQSHVDAKKNMQDRISNILDKLNPALQNTNLPNSERQRLATGFENILGNQFPDFFPSAKDVSSPGNQGNGSNALPPGAPVNAPAQTKPWYVQGKGWTTDGIKFTAGNPQQNFNRWGVS